MLTLLIVRPLVVQSYRNNLLIYFYFSLQKTCWLVENNLLDFVAVGKAMISQDKWMEKVRKDFSLRKKR